MLKRRRRFGLWISATLIILCVAGSSAAWVLRQNSLRGELEQARASIRERHFRLARAQLDRLAKSWTNDGEVLLLLGQCELELRRREEALALWAQVAPASPFFSRAAVLRATHLINSGRYTPAEEVLLQAGALPDLAPDYELERTVARLYRFEGRFDEVRRLVRASWCRSPTPAEQLKELWTHDHSPMPVEAWKRSSRRGRPE